MISRIVQTFLDLVQIDSPSGREEGVAEYISKFLNSGGVKTERDKYGNLVARIYGEGEPVILAGHMDTVEPGQGIKPIISEGIIKSSGRTILGADNKAWVAAMLEAALEVKGRNVDLIFTREEEVSDGGAAHLDLRMVRGKSGFSCDDGSPLGAIFIKSPYNIKIDITVLGRSAHSAEPEKAYNALKAASEAISLLPLGNVGDGTMRNIGSLTSGSGRNTIPGEVEVVAEIRAFEKETLSGATAEMINVFKEVALRHGCYIKKHIELENPGFEVAADDITLNVAKEVLNSMNISPRLEETYGCFDANYFNGRGIHIVNMSDGSEDTHTTREQISIENLEKLGDLAKRLVTFS